MESAAVQPAKERPVNPAVLSGQERLAPPKPAPQETRSRSGPAIGYGLPCSRCRAYYPADMKACPICRSTERVSPTAVAARPVTSPAPQPEITTQIDDERERFLKELKSQAFASHTQISTAATFRCVLEHQHNGTSEPAAVCHTCYGELKQQADRMEAALHMDMKEAAKVVYDAVWADTSDPNKTYLNAAAALLLELRRRAGIGLLLGSHQPMAH
jgi:hypothetical protein